MDSKRRQMWSEDNPMSGKTGEQHHLFGSHRTEEQNRKQAEVMKGRKPPNKGVPHTAKPMRKIVKPISARNFPMKHVKPSSEAGRKSYESRAPEQKQEWYSSAASKRFKGVPLSEDHKQKLSEAKQRQFADRPLPPSVYLDKRRQTLLSLMKPAL